MNDLDLLIVLKLFPILFLQNKVYAAYISEQDLNQVSDLVNATFLKQTTDLKADSDAKQNAFSSRSGIFSNQWPMIAGSVPFQRSVRADSFAQSRSSIDPVAIEVTQKQAELQQLLQQLYQAEADVQMQAAEVTRIQQSAAEAIQQLEDATNKARMLSVDLQAAQEEASNAALRAHTAQLQLAAHDHLMFAARQRVDSLSAQMLTAQADLANVQQVFTLNATTHHLEDQGKISVAFNVPPYGQVFTNSGQLAPEALSLGPESPLTSLEKINFLKNSQAQLSPFLNESPDSANSVDIRQIISREKSPPRQVAEYPKNNQQPLYRQDSQLQSSSLKIDPLLQEKSMSLMNELQKQAYDTSVPSQR